MSDPVSGVQSVHRALDLLEIVAAGSGSLTIAQIASAAALPSSTPAFISPAIRGTDSMYDV